MCPFHFHLPCCIHDVHDMVLHPSCSPSNLTSLPFCHPAPLQLCQIDRDEVRLRRTITKNKDEYQLDKKAIK